MRRTALLLFLLLYTCARTSATGQLYTNEVAPDDTATWTGRMQLKVDSLANLPLFETTQLGLYIRDLDEGRDLVRIHPRHRMRPASCQKVVTAVAALHHLGAAHLMRTQMLATGEVRDSVLWGDICVIGGMDPLLSVEDVARMAQAIQEAGIDSLAGRILLDTSMKDTNDWGWGWCWDDDTTPLRPLMVEKKDRFAATLLSELVKREVKGAEAGRIEAGNCPEEAHTLCEVTHTLGEALPRMMKRSDNYYAESIFYQMAAASGRRHATRKEAATYVSRLISRVGLSPTAYQIADGSGLSLYNYLTPELLVRLLEYAWQNEQIRQALYPSMPIAGVDGTLEKRMRGTAAEGNIRAKTGTVNGVSSLAGYATSPEGHTLVFCIINQGVATADAGRNWQDKVCEVLCSATQLL